jgi:hypothetical protein
MKTRIRTKTAKNRIFNIGTLSVLTMGRKLSLDRNPNSDNAATKIGVDKITGVPMDFSVDITRWIENKDRVWKTFYLPKLRLYSWYRMRLGFNASSNSMEAELSICYENPASWLTRLFTFFAAYWYCKMWLRYILKLHTEFEGTKE